MCGIAGVVGPGARFASMNVMLASQHHRGPDARGTYTSPRSTAVLGHNRLSIIDLSQAGSQPMASYDGRCHIVFNGEIYNYVELRKELHDYPYCSRSDTEVLLAAYERWGECCLDRLIGMFAFALWDDQEQRLFAARDRFGVKPLHYHQGTDGSLWFASEIKALHAAGIAREPDQAVWAAYLSGGLSDHLARTFWKDIVSLPAGHRLIWHRGATRIERWYDLAERVGPEYDERPVAEVLEEYKALVSECVRLRFRSDVPVGINLSGGLDSSTLLGIVQLVQGAESDIKAFTYVTGEPAYDEWPWVRRMLAHTHHPAVVCHLDVSEVPDLATDLQAYEDEPFGGLPAVAYTKLFGQARARGVIVLLDGQGMDEQWAGYDYYQTNAGANAALVQGTTNSPVRAECLSNDFRALAAPGVRVTSFPDPLRNLQYRDTCHTKIPKALRFNDRASMRASTELREPFLDHRLFELAFRQPPDRKVRNGVHKWFLRELAQRWLPSAITTAPKRPVSTPQREWLRGPLAGWVEDCITQALDAVGDVWLNRVAVWRAWEAFRSGRIDNSFFVWQWVSIALLLGRKARTPIAVGVRCRT